jgi:REP element-mobilizing transposase RayT
VTAAIKRKKPFLINAWVILPEHMHASGRYRKAIPIIPALAGY